MQNFEIFSQSVIDRPELYDNYNTFYIRMRNADDNTRAAYNKLKNALMSYTSRLNKSRGVDVELGPKDESFYVDDLVARFVFSGGHFFIHLKIDPSKQDKKAAIFKITDNQMVSYKLEKPNSVEQAYKAIPKMMAQLHFMSSTSYKEEDYASFFSKDIEEISDAVFKSQQEYDEKISSEQTENTASNDEVEYGDYYDDRSASRRVDSRFIGVPGATPTDDELLQAEKERQERKRKLKRVKVWDELADYGYEFVWLRYVEFYLATILIGVGLGIAYQLKLVWMLVFIVGLLLMMPGVIKSYYRGKYEEKRYDDVTTYIEQMLYSFRKNSKIIVSLRDSLSVFPEGGHMHDVISAAIHAAQTSTSGSGIYNEALSIIEKEYPCRRIRSLHRYLIKVEGHGGAHDSGVEALLKDRRLWIERIDAFRKDAGAVLTDIYISIGFSIGLACLVVRMMSTPLVDIPSNMFYQISSVVFLLVCALTIKVAAKATVLNLEDEEDEVSNKRIIDKINWLRNYDAQKELKKSIKMSIIFGVFLVVGIVLGMLPVVLLAGVALVYAVFLKRFLDKRSATKSVCRAIEKAYPDWLLELALLLQIDNLHVAIDKTLEDASLILRGDLAQLEEDIITNPTGIEPFSHFFDFLPLPQIHSSMKLLYSLSEFGQAKGTVQLMELVERNSMLMDKAEKYRNDDRLSATFVVKFIPMGISAVKLLCDLVVMLVAYMSILTTAM